MATRSSSSSAGMRGTKNALCGVRPFHQITASRGNGISLTSRNGVDAHRDDGKRFVARSDEKLTVFLELERVTHESGCADRVSKRRSIPIWTEPTRHPAPSIVSRPPFG